MTTNLHPGRPVNSMMTAALYPLSKFVAKLISPLTNDLRTTVKNSAEVVLKLKDIKLPPGYMLFTADICNMYGTLPIEPALHSLLQKLLSDFDLPKRTNLSPKEIISLSRLCLTHSYFQWKGECYVQFKGGAMGSPLVAHLADIHIDNILEQALQTWRGPILPYCFRYVDDVHSALLDSSISDFGKHLNSQHADIQWELATAKQNHLPFLDIDLHLMEDGTIQTSVFRKPTHTESYLRYDSCSPPSCKASVITTLVRRAYSLCSTKASLSNEIYYIGRVMATNLYPPSFVLKSILRIQKSLTNISSEPYTSIAKEEWPKPCQRSPSTSRCSCPNHPNIILAMGKNKVAEPGACFFGKCRFCCILWQLDHPACRLCKHHTFTFDTAERYALLQHKKCEKDQLALPPLQGPRTPPVVTIPYIPNTSESIKRILTKQGLRVVIKKNTTLKDLLSKLKDPLEFSEKNDSIYYFPFSCGACSVGQTSRPVPIRMKEHEDDIRLKRVSRSHPAAHVHTHHCHALTNQAKILAHAGPLKREREVREALFIAVARNCIAQPSIGIPRKWLKLCYEGTKRQINDCIATTSGPDETGKAPDGTGEAM